jgi:hypothetical protein
MADIPQRKQSVKELDEARQRKVMETVARRASFYRANPHRFASEYLGLTLKLFQQIIIYLMNFETNFMYLAARGQGKSFIVAVFCCIRSILYPGSAICIASKTRKQGQEVIDKIQNILMPNSPNLRSEISEIIINSQDAHVSFYNGSRIFVVTANDNARHNRANILFVDEFRMVPLEIINHVLRKFLTAPRHPKYLDKPQYAHLAERNKELYASSCWFESHWSFEKALAYVKNMIEGRKYGICALPYQLSIKENLLSREQVEDEMSESDFSEVGFRMEMECLWWSDTDGGLYSHEDIAKNRTMQFAYYPPSIAPSISDKRIRPPKKISGEKRILGVDLALMASSVKKDNDAASLFLGFMQPSNGRYVTTIPYTENIEGMRADDLAVVIRRRFSEFDCDYLAIDARGLGLPIVDLLMKEIVDPQTGEVYGALNCCNNPDIAARCADKSAPKAIWAILGSAQFNSECALSLREAFRQGSIRLLLSEYDCEDVLSLLPNWSKLTVSERMDLKMPYIHTTLLENELINLEYTSKDNVVRVQEKSGARKDRYSALSYLNYVVKELERQLAKRPRSGIGTMQQLLQFKAPSILD